MQYFNTILKEYKIMQHNGAFNYIVKDSFNGVHVMFL